MRPVNLVEEPVKQGTFILIHGRYTSHDPYIVIIAMRHHRQCDIIDNALNRLTILTNRLYAANKFHSWDKDNSL